MENEKRGNVIFIPNAEQSAQMVENAWLDFAQQAQKAGHCFDKESAEVLKDIFVAGYAFGYNDGFGIIRDQLDVMSLK